MLRKLLGARRPAAAPSSIPDGQRVYAVGDVHGRLDLLDDLLARIDADSSARGASDVTLVFLGDLVDRGPGSAGVVERLRLLAAERPATRFIMGNHEEIFLAALTGDTKALRLLVRVGGRETVLSYGMATADYEAMDYAELASVLDRMVPADHRAFLAAFEQMIVIGDYAFVHAGIRPGIPLEDQASEDLRWIRSTFLDHRGPFEKVVVHGHTVTEAPVMLPHRIGIDTGGYATGRLTALGLEGSERWFLTT